MPEEAAMLTEIAFAAKRHWGYAESWLENWTHTLTLQPAFIAEHETYAAYIDGRARGFHTVRRGPNRMYL